MADAALAFAEKPPAMRGSPSPRRPAAAPAKTAGMLLRRPDLSDEAVIAAIAERLAFEGRDPRMAASALRYAMDGRPAARALLRRLVLPAPQSALAMPTQSILRDKAPRHGVSSLARLMPFGRRPA